MEKELETALMEYARSYFSDADADLNRNIKLKLAHILRVRNEIEKLAEAESLPDRELLRRTALLHDISRFEQYRLSHSFCDANSFDHGNASAEIAEQGTWLSGLNELEKADVLAAIRAHNKLAIPAGMNERATRLSRAIRDADKLDIFRVLDGYFEHPENPAIVFGLSAEPVLTPAIRDALEKGRSPGHGDMRTACDFLAAKYAWVYDLNYPFSLAEFHRRHYLEKLRDFLPQTKEFQSIYQHAAEFTAAQAN